MSRVPDLVADSKLPVVFRDLLTVHLYRGIDESGRRSVEKQHWKWDERLGRAGYGQVFLQKCVTNGAKKGSVRAVKIIEKNVLGYVRELETIAKFSNECFASWFVKSFGWFEDSSSIFLTMEYCRHGNLRDCLKDKRSLPSVEVRDLAWQILGGLHQMHQNGFVHSDLNPGNILIKSKPPDDWWIVLSDFGISKKAEENEGLSAAVKGITEFIAPELLGYLEDTRPPPNSVDSLRAVDMWALGEIVFQMLVGEAVFQNHDEIMRFCSGQGEIPLNRLPMSDTEDCRDFVARLLKALPEHRMTTAQCVQHLWIKSLVGDECFTTNLAQIDTGPLDSVWSDSASGQLSDTPNSENSPVQMTGERHKPYRDKLALVMERKVQIPKKHDNEMLRFEVSPNGMLLMVRDPDTLFLIEVMSDVLIKTIQAPRSSFPRIRFSPDNKYIAFYNHAESSVLVCGARSGTLVRTLEAPYDAVAGVTWVEFSPDSKWLAMLSQRSTVRLWDVESGEVVREFDKGSGYEYVTRVLFSPDSKRLVSLDTRHGIVWLWNIGSGTLLKRLDPSVPVSDLKVRRYKIASAFSPDSKWLVTSTSPWDPETSTGVTILWNATSGELVRTLDGTWYHVAFLSESNLLVAVGTFVTPPVTQVRVFHVRTGEVLHGRKTRSRARMFISPDGRILAVANPGDAVQCWDTLSGTLLQTLKGTKSEYQQISFSSDSKRIVIHRRGKVSAQVWRLTR
ncbi:unnamed protein product [Periconia digitata]|uniref:non-specific serine/threonine protein kinase n=1 Tax=Periconia digitata TaxID=1303443 RepID=A0A9W4UI18_9PLEO|nr:unnamed protein product [Periconia digitata]